MGDKGTYLGKWLSGAERPAGYAAGPADGRVPATGGAGRSWSIGSICQRHTPVHD
ncbi:MAG: hypothetical protein ISS76_12220 [Phycisphaerae bacterium]|nr:hypothetical protein [Phycisphaerae bacterium]